jgi:hypothetical protein
LDEESDMGKHTAPVKAEVRLPPAGKGQIRPDPKDPRYDDASTFGKGWTQ